VFSDLHAHMRHWQQQNITPKVQASGRWVHIRFLFYCIARTHTRREEKSEAHSTPPSQTLKTTTLSLLLYDLGIPPPGILFSARW
jgi:hypothetical protein